MCAWVMAALPASTASAQSISFAWNEKVTTGIAADPDTLAGWRRAGLEGYTDKMSAKQGEALTFYVSVRNDLLPGNYTVAIYRAGASDELKTILGPYTGAFYPLYDKNGVAIYPGDTSRFPVDYRTGCNWSSAFSITISSNWPSGFYYAKLTLTADTSKVGVIPFVVKEDQPGSTSNILLVIAWNTYQAYNYFGGGSLYWWTGIFDTTAAFYIDTVSFRRPFVTHAFAAVPNTDSLGQFLFFEKQFVSWAESNGYSLEYCIDLDVHQDDPNTLPFLRNYKAVIFPGHSEYWSREMRLNISDEPASQSQPVTFMKLGGNVAFYAANNCYWRVDYHKNDTQIYCGKVREQGGTIEYNAYWWRHQPEGPEAQFMGVQFHGNNNVAGKPNRVKNQSHWIFQGTNLVNGQQFGLVGQGSQGLASGESDQHVQDTSPSNIEFLAQVTIRALIPGPGNDDHYGEVDSLRSEVTYWEDTATNARVFAAGGFGWCYALFGPDGDKIATMTRNILDHFSFKKYRGNIYAPFLTWGDDETAITLDGDTYLLANKILTLTNNFTLTINSGVTLYVQGTLVIGSNVTITGGGSIVTQGSGAIKVTNSAEALAFNNSRKLARDASGNYHVVFESDGEICYEKLNSSGALVAFRRLSAGNGSNKYPSIAERGGNIYVVWQRQYMSTHNIHFRSHVSGSWGSVQTLATGVGANPPLPVITTPATSKLMVVYRTSNNFYYRVSSNEGSSWAAATAVPWPGANDSSPALAPTTTYWGNGTRSCLVYAYNNGSTYNIYYQYYRNGPDSTEGWNTTRKNLSSIVPGSYNSHQKPSIAPSGTSGDKRLHVVWEARSGTSGNYYVIIHRKATDWYTWPNVYSATYYEQQKEPSITGLANDTAELLFKLSTQNSIYKIHYTGSSWGSPVYIGSGANPSVSVGYTAAKYVWRDGSAAPYQIKFSSEALSKAGEEPLTLAYHRSIAVIDTATALDSTRYAWLEIRLDNVAVKTKNGEEYLVPFVEAKEDSVTLTPQNIFENLASTIASVPAEAESLLIGYTFGGEGLSAINDISTNAAVDFVLNRKNGESVRFPVAAFNAENIPETKGVLALEASAFAGSEISLNTQVSGIAEKSTLLASLGHVYEIVGEKTAKELSPAASTEVPYGFTLSVHPNPFNPSTQIRFTLPAVSLVSLRIFDITGRLVRTWNEEPRSAGEHLIVWEGNDQNGRHVASGAYFAELTVNEHRKIVKMALLR